MGDGRHADGVGAEELVDEELGVQLRGGPEKVAVELERLLDPDQAGAEPELEPAQRLLLRGGVVSPSSSRAAGMPYMRATSRTLNCCDSTHC